MIMMISVRRNGLFSFMFSDGCFFHACPGAKASMIGAMSVAVLLLLMSAVCQAQPVETIRIGSIFAKTGPGAEDNSPIYRMVTLAAGQIYAAGGLLGRPVEVIEFDTGSTALGARQAAEAAV
jgi:branched-chain amino acid transport system substrate-binding protein